MTIRSVVGERDGYGKSRFSIIGANPSVLNGNFESIARVTVGAGGAANIEFTSIPSTYQHLQLRGIGRITRTGQAFDYAALTLNGSGGTNYAFHELSGFAGSPGASAAANVERINVWNFSATTATANIFGALVVDILDYANTSKNTTVRAFGGNDRNGAGELGLTSGVWKVTNAVTSVRIAPLNGTGFMQHSTFALYGVSL